MATAKVSAPSEYDSLVEQAINQGTEDWGKIINLCDKFSAASIKKEEAARAIVKNISSHNINIALISVTILDGCFNNCGKEFQAACGTPLVLDELTRLLSLKVNTPVVVCNLIKKTIQSWVVDYGHYPHVTSIYKTYATWKEDGYEFPALTKNLPVTHLQSEQALEEADLKAAVAASLKDTQCKNASPVHPLSQSLYPLLNAETQGALSPSDSPSAAEPSERYVKALYTFEVMEEGELGFVAGDVIRLLDDQHLDWWKGEFNGSVGLFPANYVQRVERYSTPQHTCLPSTVNVFVIDELLQKLHLAQSSSQSSDFIENIEKLYERVVGQMKPIVDEYLEKVNRKEEELAALNALYCESTALHDQLVKESQIAFSVQPLSQTSSNNMSTDSLSFIS